MQTQKIKTDIIKREERRKQVAQYLQENMSETEIAQKPGVNLATIYRDIEHLKQVANNFVYSLAKKDIAYF
jgi:transposase